MPLAEAGGVHSGSSIESAMTRGRVRVAASNMFGWSWADPVAGLVIATVTAKEGRDAWRGDACCMPGAQPRSATGDA